MPDTDRRRRRTLRWAAVAAAAAILASLGSPALASGASARYAALGDSYTAGPLIPDQSLNPLGCLRSDHNYPHDTTTALGLALTDISCSGATTADLTGPQSTSFGTNPAQLSVVTSSTSVVTLGIGGNDINFVGILENCAALTPYGPTLVGFTCEGHYVVHGDDTVSDAIIALGARVSTDLADIHRHAPSAQVFVIGYPAILPPSGSGCYPQLPFTYRDVPYLRAKEVQLNSELRTVAGANHATYVDTYTPSEPYNACQSEAVRWVEPLIPAAAAAPVHPNQRGEAGMAGVVEGALRAAGIS